MSLLGYSNGPAQFPRGKMTEMGFLITDRTKRDEWSFAKNVVDIVGF